LDLPEDIIPIMMITIGYEDEWKEKKKLPLKKVSEILHFWEFTKFKKK
jgi:nitroreductase